LKKLKVLLALVLVSVLFGGLTEAAEPGRWLDYTKARADITGFLGGEEQAVLEGSFSLNYPHSFSLTYVVDGSWRKIIGYRDLLQLFGLGTSEYVTDNFWLFDLYRDYVYGLAALSELALEYEGRETLAQREVDRFVDADNPDNVYWIDRQTKIPLFARQGDKPVVSVANYTFEYGFTEHYTSIELNINFTAEAGKLTLNYKDGHWVAAKIEAALPAGPKVVEFRSWQVGTDEIGDVSALKNLGVYIKEAQAALAENRWSTVLDVMKKAVAIDPQYWQGYFYLGYAYGRMGNYLGAVESYQQSLMLMPDQPGVLNNLAYTYMLQEVNLNEALALAKRAVAQDRKATNLDTLGYGYYLVGSYREAEKTLREALSLADEKEQSEIEAHLRLVQEALRKAED